MAFPGLLLVSIAVIIGLIALSAFFSSSEIAIFALQDGWLETQTNTGDRRAAILADLRGDPHRLLVTILVGNNLANVAISSITTAVLLRTFPTGVAVMVATLVASAIVLIFGEIVPKSYGLGHATSWSLVVARPLQLIERTLYPIVLVFDGSTRRINAHLGGDSGIEQPYLDE